MNFASFDQWSILNFGIPFYIRCPAGTRGFLSDFLPAELQTDAEKIVLIQILFNLNNLTANNSAVTICTYVYLRSCKLDSTISLDRSCCVRLKITLVILSSLSSVLGLGLVNLKMPPVNCLIKTLSKTGRKTPVTSSQKRSEGRPQMGHW